MPVGPQDQSRGPKPAKCWPVHMPERAFQKTEDQDQVSPGLQDDAQFKSLVQFSTAHPDQSAR